jgi:DNA-directed RNA polymerase subunit RPC12/RpoP
VLAIIISLCLYWFVFGTFFGEKSLLTGILSLVLAFSTGFGVHYLLTRGKRRNRQITRDFNEKRYKSKEDKVTSKKFCTVCKLKFFKEPEMLYKCMNCGLKMHKRCFEQVDACPTCGHSFLE